MRISIPTILSTSALVAAVPAKAYHIAPASRPGATRDEELEGKGGSGLRYSSTILVRGGIHEIGVDAKTGAVVENGVDTKAD